MRALSEIRVDIVATDSALKELFLKRMELVDQVAEYKRENMSPVRHKEREAQIIKKRTEGEEKFVPQIAEFFEQMIEISCDYQEGVLGIKGEAFKYTPMTEKEFQNGVKKVCHQGIKGSYSYEQSVKYFKDAEIMSVTTQGKDPYSRAMRRKRGYSGCGRDSRASSPVEKGMSGNFLSCSKGVKDPLEFPDVRCD